MTKLRLLIAPICLLAFVACVSPKTFPDPVLSINSSAKIVTNVIVKDGPEVLAMHCSGGVNPLDPSKVKVVQDADGVSILIWRLNNGVMSFDFTIAPRGEGCSVTLATGWQVDGSAKVPVPERVASNFNRKTRILAEIKHRAEAGF